MRKSNKKVWKIYRFEDGYTVMVRGMSAQEKSSAVRQHGKLISITDTDVSW